MTCRVLEAVSPCQRRALLSFYWNHLNKRTVCSFVSLKEPEDQEYFSQFVTLPAVRRAIHVGNLTFHDGSEVEKHLLQDVMKSIKPWLGELMDNYRVRGASGKCKVAKCEEGF